MITTHSKMGWLFLIAAISLSGAAATHANERQLRKPCQGCGGPGIGGGGGGEIPSPFNTMNQKAELSDGDLYFLVGRIVFGPPVTGSARKQAYLEVDLNQHPWLANQKRKQFPFYPLEGSTKFWERLEGQVVRMACEAHAKIVTVEKGKSDYVIFLAPQVDQTLGHD